MASTSEEPRDVSDINPKHNEALPTSVERQPSSAALGPPTILNQANIRETESGTRAREAAEISGEVPGVSSVKTAGDDPNTDGPLPPPLPPRPPRLQATQERPATSSSLHPPVVSRPSLQSKTTTALSLTDIHAQSFPDGSKGTYATSSVRSPAAPGWSLTPTGYRSNVSTSRNGSETEDAASIRSYAPTLEAGGDIESLMGEVLDSGQESPAWKLLNSQVDSEDILDLLSEEDQELELCFREEFNDLEDLSSDGSNEESLLTSWKSRLKHFFILSSAGKPIYTRHGDENLISGYIGIIQTIISFYQDVGDSLRGFTAGNVRFVIMTEGPIYLVAISRLGESDTQLWTQLEALYMQILSTLTLPTLTHLFTTRPSTDLRRLLHGTEPLLSALADTFTRGSPPTLLSALECLKIRKSHRHVVNNTLLKARSPGLLYGLIVAGGRLVSVVRPKRHSLHPSDLQLIFNMLFEAEGVKAGGGENWIPLCLPGFNKKGYLYMYVSFLSKQGLEGNSLDDRVESRVKEEEIAVVLISADKESFYELKKMRDDVVQQLEKNGSMSIIKSAVERGRYSTSEIVPGTVLRHFLYKSRANVQFTMPSYDPHFSTPLARRRLLSLYHLLHSSVHAKNAHLKVQHCISRDSISLGWVTPLFELFCVAGPNATRNALAQGANKVVQWVRKEEERVFIIGGAVF